MMARDAERISGLPLDRLKELCDLGVLSPVITSTGELGFYEDEVQRLLDGVAKGWMSSIN